MNVKIKVDNSNCIPNRAHKWDAGVDLVSNNKTFTIKPGEKIKVHTGISLEIPVRHMGLIVPRSGLGSKYRIGLANTIGVIDSEYRGEIMVNLVNDGNESLEIKQFDRFCQLVIVPVLLTSFKEVQELNVSKRGEGGFGSTGINDKLTELEKTISDNDFDSELELEEILEWIEDDSSN